MKPRLSLKGRALQLLSQREHSRLELRRKLLRPPRARRPSHPTGQDTTHHATDRARHLGVDADLGADSHANTGTRVGTDSDAPAHPLAHAGVRRGAYETDAPNHTTATELAAEVDAVLDWLQAHRFLCDERFVESRVHARASRFGNLRIKQELSQHGVVLSADTASALHDSEIARATDVLQRKFSTAPANQRERAKQARFLSSRGFSSDVVWRVLRTSVESDADSD